MENNIPNCFYRVSAKALIFDEQGKFLIVREDKGGWDLPGGGIDWGETVEECIVREIKEEMGLIVTEVNPSLSYTLISKHKNGNWIMSLVYHTKIKDLNFTPTPECREIKFISTNEVDSIEALESVKRLAKLIR